MMNPSKLTKISGVKNYKEGSNLQILHLQISKMLMAELGNCFFFSKVGPVADDIKTGGTYAVLASLLGNLSFISYSDFNKWYLFGW